MTVLPRRIAIVTPVLSDWKSFAKLVSEIRELPVLSKADVCVVAVDDGSPILETPSDDLIGGPVREIQVVRLKANLSHQRAIAIGLAHVERELDVDLVIVMDSDGEDQPCDMEPMLKAHDDQPGAIVVARRRKRSEGKRFKLGYAVYKFVFALLTGQAISFGNFSLIPRNRLPNIVYNPSIWNSFSATLLRSRVPIEFVETDRGKRYFGRSSMNFSGLVVHGMSAISVYSDVVITRMIIGLALLGVLFAVAVAAIIGLKIVADMYDMTGFFIPGYATNLVLSLANLVASTMFIGFVGILSLLAARSHAAAMPSQLVDELVAQVDKVFAAPRLKGVAR